MIKFVQKGNFNETEKFLNSASKLNYKSILERYGQEGVNALSIATPVDSGLTADSWTYDVKVSNGSATISWYNSNVVDGVPIVILIQYGHATRNGGYVQGQDFINPTMKPIFDRIASDAWREVATL